MNITRWGVITLLFVFALTGRQAAAETATAANQTSFPSRSINLFGHTVTRQEVAECSIRKKDSKQLEKYLNQYDVQTERDFYSTAYKYSEIDPSDGYPSGDLEKNWLNQAREEVVGFGFGHGDGSSAPILWMSFTGEGTCDFSSFQSLVGMRASVGRWFLFRGLKKKGYQLVMSDAGDQGGAYGQGFISLTVSSESLPVIVYLGSGSGDVFQWNQSIKGFNVCPKTSDVDEMSAFKIYTKTAIAPKDSFLGKLCASPEARAKLDRFLDGAH